MHAETRPQFESRPLALALADKATIWQDLLDRTSHASPFMTPAWHRAWEATAARGERGRPEVLVMQDGVGAPAALLPLAYRKTRLWHMPVSALTWAIDEFGCPDHLDFPATDAVDFDALAERLEKRRWDVLLFDNVAEGTTNVSRLADALARRGHLLHREPLYHCARLELEPTWEEVLAAMPASTRKNLRRRERRAEEEFTVTTTTWDGERFEEGWAHFVRLHEMRWGGRGIFADPANARRHHAFARELSAAGLLLLLTIEFDGVPVAVQCAFEQGDTIYLYNCGRNPTFDRLGVGQLIHGAMVRRAVERGMRAIDWLRGDEDYKAYYSGDGRYTWRYVVCRHGWRTGIFRGLRAARAFRTRRREAAALAAQVTAAITAI